jgi:RimJ/RimL family protein N-acetyltransferase
MPGNPQGVVIEQIGPTRTFIARGDRLENRAIFTGEESEEQIDRVLEHFVDHGANFVIEINPANYYVDPPAVWEKRLLRHLLARGCVIHGFRCVWSLSSRQNDEKTPERHRWRRFAAEEIDDFLALARVVEPKRQWTDADRAAHARPGVFHYVGFDGDTPAALGTLFVNGPTGYLQWWFTNPEHRRKGFQREGIRRRVRDAFELRCERVFTVADFNTISAANLQQCGFRLAYNYLLLRRDPAPVLS